MRVANSTIYRAFPVEEQFYLILPALVRYCSRRCLIILALGSIVLAPCLRYFCNTVLQNEIAGYTLLPCRADALAYGVLIALAQRTPSVWAWLEQQQKQLVLVLVFLGGGMIRWSFFDFFLPDAFGKTWVALFYALLLILTLIAPRAGRVFINPVLIWLGTRAFALYLLHSLMLELTHAAVRHSSATVDTQMGALTTLLALGFTCGLAALSWNLLEAPLTERARRCFIYQRLGP